MQYLPFNKKLVNCSFVDRKSIIIKGIIVFALRPTRFQSVDFVYAGRDVQSLFIFVVVFIF